MAAAIFIVPAYLHFVLTVLGKQESHRRYMAEVYVMAIAFFLIDILAPSASLFVRSVEPVFSYAFWPKPGVLFHPFLVLWGSCLVYAMLLLFRERQTVRDHITRRQISFLLVTMLLAFASGSTNFLLWYGIPVPPFLNIAVSVYVLAVGYVVVRHNLFNLRGVLIEMIVFMQLIFTTFVMMFVPNISSLPIRLSIVAFALVSSAFVIHFSHRIVRDRDVMWRMNSHLAALNKLKNDLFTLAAHRLRAPLVIIEGYTSLMRDGTFGELPPGLQKAEEGIFASTKAMLEMINLFFEASRLSVGDVTFVCAPFEIAEAVQAAAQRIAPFAKEHGVSLTLSTAVGGRVVGDRPHFDRVLDLLLDNACRYTHSGGTVAVSIIPSPQHIGVEVRDNGIGIPKESLAHVFECFSRAPNANSIDVLGSGLGLYIAERIVSGLGGTISVDSEGEGKGSVFRVEMPTCE